MKNLRQWLLALMRTFMLVGIATGCSSKDTNTDGTKTEENQNTKDGTGTDTNGK